MDVPQMSTQLILNADSKERRELARAGMAAYNAVGMFHYILDCPYVRHDQAGELYSIVDFVNVFSDSEQEPRKVWNDMKARVLLEIPDASERIRHILMGEWGGSKRRQKTDMTDRGAMLTILQEMHTPLSKILRQAMNDMLVKYDPKDRDKIILEMGRSSGWAATRNHIAMIEAECSYVQDSELEWWQR